MFERDSKEKLLQKMVNWSRAVSPKITDFRRGSVIRTIYESVALIIEGGYNKFYVALKSIIERNIYSVIGFDKIQAVPSSGNVIFGRVEPAVEAYVIPRGTEIVARANDFRPPISFRTVEDSIMDIGYTEVSVGVVCTEAGAITNVLASDINDFVTKPFGIDWVTNRVDFLNGRDEETPEEQKSRFGDYMEANTRGTLQSIEFGAKQAFLYDSAGIVTEQALSVLAVEDTVLKKGEVDLYVWNGVGDPSEALKAKMQEILLGYYDENGDRVYGYKNGGTQVNIYPALRSSVRIRLTLTTESWASEAYVKDRIQKEVDSLFRSLRIGQTLLHSSLLSRVKGIEGVHDVKVELSINAGASYSADNVVVSQSTINVLETIVYA